MTNGLGGAQIETLPILVLVLYVAMVLWYASHLLVTGTQSVGKYK